MSEKGRVVIELTLQGAGQLARGVGVGITAFGKMSNTVGIATTGLSSFISVGKDVFSLTTRLASGVRSIADALLDPNEQFEVASLQFEQLLGSADAAQDRIEVLYNFANSTPFLNPDVVKAGKILQAFGQDQLGVGKALKMTGDMAAFANVEMSEIAIWVGRAFSAIQSGKPFGEAAQRLQELTLLTGEERNLLEDLAKSGASSTQIWEAFTQTMDKVDGSAKRISDSMQGAKSTIKGLSQEIIRLTGEGLFKGVKADVIDFRDTLSEAFETGRVKKFTSEASKIIADFYKDVKDQSLGEGFSLQTLLDAGESGKLGDLLTIIVKGAAHNFWEAIKAGAINNAPTIQRAIIPQKLHGILGLKQDQLLGDAASGDFSRVGEVSGRQGILLRIVRSKRGDKAASAFAESQSERAVPNFIDIAAQIQELNIPTTARAAVLEAGDEDGRSEERKERDATIDFFKSMRDSVSRAATEAEKLADQLANANEAAF